MILRISIIMQTSRDKNIEWTWTWRTRRVASSMQRVDDEQEHDHNEYISVRVSASSFLSILFELEAWGTIWDYDHHTESWVTRGTEQEDSSCSLLLPVMRRIDKYAPSMLMHCRCYAEDCWGLLRPGWVLTMMINDAGKEEYQSGDNINTIPFYPTHLPVGSRGAS